MIQENSASQGPVRAKHSPRLASLTGMRFFAALLVVLAHAGGTFIGEDSSIVLGMGALGVSFFYLLSGFVLTWSWKPDQPKGTFYRNRFARIYPLHLLTLTAGAILVFISGPATPWLGLIPSLLLVQSWIPASEFYFAFNGPSWSLACEVFFYACFPFLVVLLNRLGRRRLMHFMLALYAVVVLVTLWTHLAIGGDLSFWMLYINPSYRIWEFAIGICIALLIRGGWQPRFSLRSSLLITCAMLAAAATLNIIINTNQPFFDRFSVQTLPLDLASLILVPCFGYVIAAAATTDIEDRPSRFRHRIVVRLGEWSFALYMSHLLLMYVVRLFLPDELPLWLSIPVASAVVSVAVCLSALLFTYVERPWEAKLRSHQSGNLDQSATSTAHIVPSKT